MRASCVGLISVLTLLIAHSLARPECFSKLFQADREALEAWPYSPLKQVDFLGITSWDQMPVRKEILEQQLAGELLEQLERRCIITRRKGADTPTWDGAIPAFVFDPLLWYFDPDYPFGAAEDTRDAFTDASDEIMHGFIISRMNFGGELNDVRDSFLRPMYSGWEQSGYYARVRANRRRLRLLAGADQVARLTLADYMSEGHHLPIPSGNVEMGNYLYR